MEEDPEVSDPRYRPQPTPYRFRLWFLPRFGFPVRQEERLYLDYTKSQRQRAIPRLLATGVILQVFTALVPGETDFDMAYATTSVGLCANMSLAALYYYIRSRRTIISHLSWLALWAQLLANASRRRGDSYNELLAWAAILQYFTLAALPFRILTLIAYSIISFTAYLLVQFTNALESDSRLPEDFLFQELGNGSILLCASLMGATAFIVYENQQRRSFMETKRSLRDKLTIDQQSKEQERLLLSVLPEHVAVEMRRDLGLIDTQFKKIYMSRHENVSILYADIVGFTAISSTYSAQDLVAILNELFARFDRLAEKYQQLRIKILGDCYYCISGAPVERPDHAVLCVHMGLSMVKAIKYVQQTTNSPVDMRVGIHTGAVLAGVLGQRQWQFDVYSRDVELANKMESSGMAGRVHISEVTLSYLKDEFEVEPAYGEKREEMLRQAGIKTYFITKVLIPYHGDERSADAERGDTLSDLRDDDEDSVLSPEGEQQDSEETLIHEMLVEELVNRDDDKELASTGIWLTFSLKEEEVYQKRGEPPPALVMAIPIYLLVPIIALACFTNPHPLSTFIIYAALTALGAFMYFSLCKLWRMKGFRYRNGFGMVYKTCVIHGYTITSVIPLLRCAMFEQNLRDGNVDAIQDSANRCLHPSYFFHMCVCGLLNVLMLSPSTCLFRITYMSGLLSLHFLPLILRPIIIEPRPTLDHDPYLSLDNATISAMEFSPEFIDILAFVHRIRHFIMIWLVGLAIAVFDRYLESMQRARHSRGERMRRQAEQAGDLRRRNQALVYNVLPPHVARHFMGAHRHHRDLYSQSYADVGVLFASMPNFTEFYSEETVNNQGLECLRFLNEVISDFDLLLEDAKFRDIIKIKTISSTYMAASGLNPKREIKESDGAVVRWEHLMCLVEFALELQRVLAAINEQSFNHFVLRMGVNHGPITAGVIGARKPHYDIWGNTVNVASRMESTGKAGCIQVTEETCHILEDFGYYFEQRGLVAVKGKGQLMTYYLQGRAGNNKPKIDAPKQAEEATALSEGGPEAALIVNGVAGVPGAAAALGVAQDDADHDEAVTGAGLPLLPGPK